MASTSSSVSVTAVVTNLANGSFFSPPLCINRSKVSCILVGTSRMLSSVLSVVVVTVVVVFVVVVVLVVVVVVEGTSVVEAGSLTSPMVLLAVTVIWGSGGSSKLA